MAISKRKCKQCGEYRDATTGLKTPAGWFCSHDHATSFALEQSKKKREKAAAKRHNDAVKVEREQRKALTARRKELNRTKHLDMLQKLVNQYVVHVRDAGKPCCTCGNSNPSIKFDAGHYRSRGACPELRFELTNIHKQCSVRCNIYASGARAEYRQFIIATYGEGHLEWLDGKHAPLKDQLPDAEAIDSEISRYRTLLRGAGLKPAT